MDALQAETQALLDEMIASLPSTPPEMRPIVEAQIQNLKNSLRALEKAAPAMEANKQYRPAVSPQMRAFFTPEQGPVIPTWVPDTLTRSLASTKVMRCPPGARVYEEAESLVCAVPQGIGAIPVRNGLSLGFYHSERLRSQGYYEQGLLRWSISYHANGGRETFGFYADRAPREHLAHGLHTTLASSGRVITQAHYQFGQRHGWTKIWEEDGYPVSATLYERDRQMDQLLPDGSRP